MNTTVSTGSSPSMTYSLSLGVESVPIATRRFLQGRSAGTPAAVWLCRLFVAACVAFVPSAQADEITTHDEHYRKIKIIDYAYGRIRFREPAGDLADVPILEVRALLVDTVGGVDDLNQAEIYIDKGQPSQAVLRYERALRSTRGFWRELVRVRLLQACDQAGYPDKAVTHWLALLKRDPALASELLLTSIPPTRTRAVRRALSDLEATLAKNTDETTRRLMELLRFSIYRRLGEDVADELAMRIVLSPLTGPIATVPAYGIKTDALRRAFQMKRIKETLSGLEGALEDCPETSLPDLLLLKGEVLYATAEERVDYIRSAWVFMRVPIHFPDDPRAAQALLWAARAHEKLDAPEKAVELLRECLALEFVAPEIHAQAAEALQRLTERQGVSPRSKVQGPKSKVQSRGFWVLTLDLGLWTLDSSWLRRCWRETFDSVGSGVPGRRHGVDRHSRSRPNRGRRGARRDDQGVRSFCRRWGAHHLVCADPAFGGDHRPDHRALPGHPAGYGDSRGRRAAPHQIPGAETIH